MDKPISPIRQKAKDAVIDLLSTVQGTSTLTNMMELAYLRGRADAIAEELARNPYAPDYRKGAA